MTGATVVLGIGLVPANPSLATTAVLVAASLVVVASVVPASRLRLARPAVVGVLVAGILAEGAVLAMRPALPDPAYRVLLVAVTLSAVSAVLIERWRWAMAALALGIHLAVMWWMLAAAEVPRIDVILFQEDALAALLRGVNPYGIRFENLYFGAPVEYYAPELMVGRELDFGFPYPPLSLLFALPGHLVVGDVRFGAAAAITATALVVMNARPGSLAIGAAMLILLAPATQTLLHGGWTEPYVALLLAATAWFALRRPGAVPIWLGLVVAVKQYCAPILLLGFFLLREVRVSIGPRRLMLLPVAVAAATVLPFAVWDLPALVHSTIGVQLIQPFRIDALSIPAQLARSGLEPTPTVLAFLAGGLTFASVSAVVPRTVAGFCYAIAATLMMFFLFNKQAFLNYYFAVLVALACAIATASSPNSGRRLGG